MNPNAIQCIVAPLMKIPLNGMLTTVSILAAALYLIAAVYQGAYVFGQITRPPRHALMLSIGFAAVTVHGIAVYIGVYQQHALDLGFYRVLALIAWFCALIALLMTFRRPSDNLLALSAPLIIMALLVALLTPPSASNEFYHFTSAGMALHILSSILAYAVLSIATLQALVLAVQERLLKHHRFSGLLRTLPPLQTMEAMLFELIFVGVIMLTVSIASGAIFIDNIFAQHLAHKTVLSILAWVLFTTLLWGRYQLGWRSSTAVRWTISGFTLLMLGFLGSKFVLEIILQRA